MNELEFYRDGVFVLPPGYELCIIPPRLLRPRLPVPPQLVAESRALLGGKAEDPGQWVLHVPPRALKAHRALSWWFLLKQIQATVLNLPRCNE